MPLVAETNVRVLCWEGAWEGGARGCGRRWEQEIDIAVIESGFERHVSLNNALKGMCFE